MKPMSRRDMSLSFSIGAILISSRYVFDLPEAMGAGLVMAGVSLGLSPIWWNWLAARRAGSAEEDAA